MHATIHADTSRLAFQIIACSYISKVTRVYNMRKNAAEFLPPNNPDESC